MKPPLPGSRWFKLGQLSAVCLVALFLVACAGDLNVPTNPSSGPALPVAREFAPFYEEIGGRDLLGDPVTEAFTIEDEGPLYQYFQALRLVYDDAPGLAPGQRVSVSPLGEWALSGLSQPVAAPISEGRESRYFPQSGETVAGDFLAFYDAHHGDRLLGPPISPPLDRDGLAVQYFRNGRLDWYPELPEGQRVRLGSLGQAHFDAVMAFSYRQALSSQFVPAVTVTAVEVFAYLQHPVLYAGDQQVLYVTVFTPEGRPVSGLTIQVATSDGRVSEIQEVELKEDQNKLQLTLDAGEFLPGERIDLTVSVLSSSSNLLGSDRLSFKTWW